jgi:LacI family transcriptional regulator
MPPARRVAVMFELEWPHKRHADIFAGTQRYANERGWDSIIDEFVDETLTRNISQSNLYDGIIGRVNEKQARVAIRQGIPVVNVWFNSPAWNRLPGVFPDFAAAGRLRAEHLLARGLRRFSVLTRKERGAGTQTTAFRETVAASGFECSTVSLPMHPTRTFKQWQRCERQIVEFMDQWEPPIGVYAVVDEIGRMIAQLCQRRGWRVPEDVAIITGSNEETICEHARPSLTSVEFGYTQVGYQAAMLLDRLMQEQSKGKKKKPGQRPTHVIIPPEGLVVRESTDFFAVDDALVADALAFIAANCHRPLGQQDVSRAVNAETRTLQMRFRKFLDRPIVAVIRQLRIERAKRELVQSNRTMQEIAKDIGFGDPARMNDTFRRELGITPSEYRRQRQLDRRV